MAEIYDQVEAYDDQELYEDVGGPAQGPPNGVARFNSNGPQQPPLPQRQSPSQPDQRASTLPPPPPIPHRAPTTTLTTKTLPDKKSPKAKSPPAKGKSPPPKSSGGGGGGIDINEIVKKRKGMSTNFDHLEKGKKKTEDDQPAPWLKEIGKKRLSMTEDEMKTKLPPEKEEEIPELFKRMRNLSIASSEEDPGSPTTKKPPPTATKPRGASMAETITEESSPATKPKITPRPGQKPVPAGKPPTLAPKPGQSPTLTRKPESQNPKPPPKPREDGSQSSESGSGSVKALAASLFQQESPSVPRKPSDHPAKPPPKPKPVPPPRDISDSPPTERAPPPPASAPPPSTALPQIKSPPPTSKPPPPSEAPPPPSEAPPPSLPAMGPPVIRPPKATPSREPPLSTTLPPKPPPTGPPPTTEAPPSVPVRPPATHGEPTPPTSVLRYRRLPLPPVDINNPPPVPSRSLKPALPALPKRPPLIPTESMIDDDEGEDIYDDATSALPTSSDAVEEEEEGEELYDDITSTKPPPPTTNPPPSMQVPQEPIQSDDEEGDELYDDITTSKPPPLPSRPSPSAPQGSGPPLFAPPPPDIQEDYEEPINLRQPDLPVPDIMEDDQEIYEGLEGDDILPPVPSPTVQHVPPSLPAPLDHSLAPPLPSNRAASPASPKKTLSKKEQKEEEKRQKELRRQEQLREKERKRLEELKAKNKQKTIKYFKDYKLPNELLPLYSVEVIEDRNPKEKDHVSVRKGDKLGAILIAHPCLPSGKLLVEKDDGSIGLIDAAATLRTVYSSYQQVQQEEEGNDFGYNDEDIYEALGEEPIPEEPVPLPPRSGHPVPPVQDDQDTYDCLGEN